MNEEGLISNLNELVKKSTNKECENNLYNHLTGSSWWNDKEVVDNAQRKNYLYETFFKYYNLITYDEIKELKKNNVTLDSSRYWLVNMCKMQLDKELAKL